MKLYEREPADLFEDANISGAAVHGVVRFGTGPGGEYRLVF